MEFILGCNYWASNAGTEMWQNFDIKAIDNDLKTLSNYGVKYLRVFPLWRDFQPANPMTSAKGEISGYLINRDEADNKYYLDEAMLCRFSDFLSICEKYGLKVLVGLITGWMSGALFIPTALYGKNLITDPLAIHFEQLFIKGFVERFKDSQVIFAWDIGNECNCMSHVSSRWEAAAWTATISNAIRASDRSRPVVSGMHGLNISEGWTIADQGEFTDILTTHPYPFWCEHTRIDKTLAPRTTLLPTAQGKYYSDIGKRPCLAEEFGTMGPMICSDELSADFLRVNLFSLWANGGIGLMWWCSSDQTALCTFPYTEQMVERELGMLRTDGSPKPVLCEMKKFSEFLSTLDFKLPEYKSDAVCVLTRGQRHWGIAYMTYMLARKSGLNISFAFGDDKLPDSKLYILPSVNEFKIMPKSKYEELKRRVYEGADLYISINNAILSEFEALTGLKVIDSYEYKKDYSTDLNGKKICFSRLRNITLTPVGAEVICRDNEGNPFVTVNRYGKGRVFFVNAPIEDNLIDMPNAFDSNEHLIYSTLFADHKPCIPVKSENSSLLLTSHHTEDGDIITVINHSEKESDFSVETDKGYVIDRIFYGSIQSVKPYDACVFSIKKT